MRLETLFGVAFRCTVGDLVVQREFHFRGGVKMKDKIRRARPGRWRTKTGGAHPTMWGALTAARKMHG